jgi:CheY-like chemotaxis protein
MLRTELSNNGNAHAKMTLLQNAGEHLLCVINDVLDFSRLKARSWSSLKWKTPATASPPISAHASLTHSIRLMRVVNARQAGGSGLGIVCAALALPERACSGLILMDYHMPQMGGIEATKRIRAIEQDRRLALTLIVAMSASNQPSVASSAIGDPVAMKAHGHTLGQLHHGLRCTREVIGIEHVQLALVRFTVDDQAHQPAVQLG